MRVGIDESGDFRLDSRAFFAAVLIRPSAYEQVIADHRSWERETRRRLGLQNEIKSTALDEEARTAFIERVLDREPTPVIYKAYAVDVDAETMQAMNVQRLTFSTAYDGQADTQDQSPDPEVRQGAKSYRSQAHWIRGLSDTALVKLMTLAAIVPSVVEWAVGFSIAKGFDDELDRLQVTIDRGYIKGAELASWREVLRNVFITETRRRPLTYSAEWTDEHPFLVRFVERVKGDGMLLKPAFKEMIDFADSTASPEVRIADVVAGIVRSSHTVPGGETSAERLSPFSAPPRPYTLLRWDPARRDPAPNPYLEFYDEDVDPPTEGDREST